MRWLHLNKSDVLAYVVNNIICVVCFSTLAILFDKWWIALFAFLFFALPSKYVKKYYRVCDECGKYSPYADSYNEAIDKATKAGWVRWKENDEWEDYCPECQSKWKAANKN